MIRLALSVINILQPSMSTITGIGYLVLQRQHLALGVKNLCQRGNQSVVARVGHAVAPGNLLLISVTRFEEEFTTVLAGVAGLGHQSTGDVLESLNHRFPDEAHHALAEVLRALSHSVRGDHA